MAGIRTYVRARREPTLVTPLLLNFFGGLADYIDSLFNWPPEPQTDQGELIWVAMTLAVSFAFMIMVGRWWQR